MPVEILKLITVLITHRLARYGFRYPYIPLQRDCPKTYLARMKAWINQSRFS